MALRSAMVLRTVRQRNRGSDMAEVDIKVVVAMWILCISLIVYVWLHYNTVFDEWVILELQLFRSRLKNVFLKLTSPIVFLFFKALVWIVCMRARFKIKKLVREKKRELRKRGVIQ